MNWVEIIHLRSTGNKQQLIQSHLQELVSEVNNCSKNLTIRSYIRFKLKSDYCVHLHHTSKTIEEGGSRLANHLVNELKQYGIVNHTVWSTHAG